MDFKKLLILFAILFVVVTAGAVCAADAEDPEDRCGG